jgi:hypothetical protein
MAALRGEDGPHGRDRPLGLPDTGADGGLGVGEGTGVFDSTLEMWLGRILRG